MLKALHEHEKLFDAKKFDEVKTFYSNKFTYTKSTGEVFANGMKQVQNDYAMFSEFFHEPCYGVEVETAHGHRLKGSSVF